MADSLTTKKTWPKGKHPGGRPTKYNSGIIRKTKEYLDDYEKHGHKLPTLAGLSLVLGINKETVQQWITHDDKKEFSVLTSKIMSAQEQMLLNNGLDNTWNSGIARLVLSKHGYTDKVDNSGPTIQVVINRDDVTLRAGEDVIEIE